MMNGFIGTRSDRMLEELWMEGHIIVQETVTKTIPKKNKCKKAKRLAEEDLQIAEERREAKGKRERRSNIQLNAKFQRITRRDIMSFLNAKKQSKTIEWGRLEISSRKFGAIKGTFHARMGMIHAETVRT